MVTNNVNSINSLMGSFSGATKYYTNCRGANFIPAMKLEWERSGYLPRLPDVAPANIYLAGGVYPVSDSFVGSNKTTQWWYYNTEDNENSLKLLKSIGINSVRVFSNIYVWQRDRAKYINAIKDFHRLCDKYKIKVEWVIWDGIELPLNALVTEPTTPTSRTMTTSALEYSLMRQWTQIPFSFEVSSSAQASNFFTTCATPFLNDMVSSVSGYQSLWAFDMLNEGSDSQVKLVSSTSLLLSGLLSSVGIGLTFGHGESFQPYSGCSQSVYPNLIFQLSSYINFASIHVYSNSRFGLLRMLYEAASGSRMINKPAMFNESHFPDSFQWTYNDLEYFSSMNFGGLGFDAMIDHGLSQEPFLNSQGIFFWDGRVRKLEDAMAYVRVASGANWLRPSQLNYSIEEKSSTTNAGLDGGYWSGVIPEHSSFNSTLYTSANSSKWEIVKDRYYNGIAGILPAGFTIYNPTFSKNFPPFVGHEYSNNLGYGFTSSGVDYEDAYNILANWTTYFPPLASLPDAASGPVFQAKNKSIVLRTDLLRNLHLTTLDIYSGSNWTKLIGTACDPNPVASSTRITLSSLINGYDTLLAGSKVPAVNNMLATSSSMACLPSNCLTTGGGAIDWAAYDTRYTNIVSTMKTCLDSLITLGQTNDRYRLF